ncbi:hypothetical protein ACG33_09790 [Steroidobacter denitrificans]|uniref:SnoaL-like domain-containing protein n=1 Tax=Steroidobacter denitrificans TaxID=465721 RepID=A0A127FAE0_STEDE|nr:nuclear transport factor 2 family protein [Steroidobacter denitrificans]AMN47383.1 hypothetical protein ACG33_09790 [Steroidobacter denitrificans]
MNSRYLWAITAVLCAVIGYAAAGVDRESVEERLRSEAEIGRLAVNYAWAVDEKKIDAMMALFAENAVYDLSAYGHASVAGRAAIRELFLQSVFRAEQCSFSSISNLRTDIQGTRASGADYFVHLGYNNPNHGANTRHYVEGRHYYDFVKEKGEWKISRMQGQPTFERIESFPPAAMKHCP